MQGGCSVQWISIEKLINDRDEYFLKGVTNGAVTGKKIVLNVSAVDLASSSLDQT
jgi:hypothetical protein